MDKVIEGLRKRHSNIHPLVFHRSVEKAKTHGELFDILEEIPTEFPIFWDEKTRRWQHTDNLLQKTNLKKA